ncbi:MAG: SPOR domain-containing protein [Gemmatimonadota bacterium]
MMPVSPLVARWAAVAALALAVTLGGGVRPLAAQVDIEEIDALARSGRATEARAALVTWWDTEHDEADRETQQRALWLRARLTVDPEQAMRDYQRLVVLYPGGMFTDQALFRLAQAAHALGDGRQARAHVEALVRDYPRSQVRRSAETWLQSAGDPPPPPQRAQSTEEPERAPARAGGDPGASEQTEPVRYYAVQLGAFGEEERAMSVAAAGLEAGFDVRVVRVEGSPFMHVRVGMFPERPEALELFNSLARAGVQGALVQDDRAELPAPR